MASGDNLISDGYTVSFNIKDVPRLIFSNIFSYSTVRLAKINSFKVALTFRILQLVIIGYIVGWSIVYKKGYQEFDTVSSVVTTKVKGLGNTILDNTTNGTSYRLFDTADYVIPPAEYNSVFIMTNFVETSQTQDICDEDYNKVNSTCETDKDCFQKAKTVHNWNGIPTGRCITSSTNDTVKTCEIAAWCPVEREKKGTQNLIRNVEEFTMFIKNDVHFDLFDTQHRNILPDFTDAVIASCTYDEVENPFCPVFKISDLLTKAEPDESEREKMLLKGGVIQIKIYWGCNYDKFWRDCTPKYTIDRFDVPFKEVSAASGFNFRFSDKFVSNDVEYRVLTKSYGLRFIINVDGKAGKFNIVPLLLTLGAGIGLLSIATILADIFLITCTKKKKFYRQLKELDYDEGSDIKLDIDQSMSTTKDV